MREVGFWEPGKILKGQTVVVIGNGPSLRQVTPGEIQGYRFIAVNSACRWAEPIVTAQDMLYFTDNSWAERFGALVLNWPGLAITSNSAAASRLGCLRLDARALTEWCGVLPDHAQASSGHLAAALAGWLGAIRVVLLGFDGKRVAGRSHWHEDYEEKADPYVDRFIPGWQALAPALARKGVELVNATIGSAIDAVPVLKLKDCLYA